MSSSDDRVVRLMKAIGARRRSLRPEASQETVAHEAGISLRHYQKIEKAVGDPKLTTLLDIASALGTTLQSLLDDAKL